MKLNGEVIYLWRAVDQEGELLESFVTKKRDKSAALAFMMKALKRHGRPKAVVTGSDPLRRRERVTLRFRRMKTLQKFASVPASLHNHFASERHLIDRQTIAHRRLRKLAA